MKKTDFSKLTQDIKKSFTKEAAKDKSFKLGGYSVVSGIVVICIAVFAILAVNALSSKYTKLDFTSAKLYSVSQETENVVKKLDKDVTVYFLATTGSEDALIKNILEKYDDLSDKLKVVVKDPAVNPNFASKYTSLKVSANSVIVECGEKSRFIAYADMYNTNYDYQTGEQTQEFNAESSITSAISYVSGDNFPKVYMTSGHGEAELDTTMTEAIKKNNVETETISLVTADSIPEDASCVMIYQPQNDISENEKTLLLKYLKNGGNLLLFNGYTGEDTPNINALMENYGVTSENAVVFEGDNSKALTGYNYFLVPDIAEHDTTTPLIESKYSVLIPLARPILHNDVASSATVTDLFTTSDSAYVKTNLDSTTEKETGDKEGKSIVGVAITDTNDNKESHIIWVTSGQMFDNEINQVVAGANQDFLLNAINWMSDREESIAIHPKTLSAEYLTVSSGASTVWSIIFVFLIPVLVLAIGIYVWVRRKSR